MNQDDRELVGLACAARQRAYAPYSGFCVGAAVRAVDGSVHVGVNVENVSFGLSVCAERHAVAAAVAANVCDLAAIAICGGGEEPTPPCGACRQVLHEFAPDLRVVMAGAAGVDGPVEVANLVDLLPGAFADFDGDRPGAP